MEDPKATSQSTVFFVTIPSFIGTNWYEVKSHIVQLLATCIGSAGITLPYLIKYAWRYWEDKKIILSFQYRRTATKMHSGNSFDIDNKDIFCILSNTFSSTTVDYVTLCHQMTHNGSMLWKIIKANVLCSSYNRKYKIQGSTIIDHEFFDPTNNFSLVKYFQLHVKSHETHIAA